MDHPFDIIFGLIFGGMLLYWVFNIVRRGGFKGAAFDAKILETVGEIEGMPRLLMRAKLKVYVLDRNPEKMLGIELSYSNVGSYEMNPINLSATEAKKLVSVLEQAIAKI